MTWILTYLLAGFVLSWVASVNGMQITNEWYWELLAVVCWPVTVVLAFVKASRQ